MKVHTQLGPSLLEIAYEECLFYSLQKEGFSVQNQVALPLIYDEVKMEKIRTTLWLKKVPT